MNTSFSKNFFILITIIILVGLTVWFVINNQSPIQDPVELGIDTEVVDTKEQTTQVGEYITIDAENITGSYPEIIGESTIAVSARERISDFVTDITRQANEQLPELREEFPDAYSNMKYNVEVQANYYTSESNQSLVLLQYMYTGGANGTSFYQSFNQNSEGEIISLADIIPAEKRAAFVNVVKERIRSEHSDEGLFDNAVEGITFEQLDRFARDNNTLNIYFDEYEVAPGATGSFEVSLSGIEELINDLPSTDPQNPVFSWLYEEVEDEEYPKTDVVLAVDYGNENSSRYRIETVTGSCNQVDEDNYSSDEYEATITKNSSIILCYYAGFGRVFRVIDQGNNYIVQGKNIEEGTPDYNPPETPFETIMNIPKK